MKYGPEEQLQLSCVQFVKTFCPNVMIIASQNRIAPKTRTGAYFGFLNKMEKLGLVKGEPDLRIHYPVGRTCYVELKAGRNKPTDDQLGVIKQLSAMGVAATWTNSLDGFVAFLRECGVPMKSFH